jgi:N-acetylmuramoyl-L-alanine amidase
MMKVKKSKNKKFIITSLLMIAVFSILIFAFPSQYKKTLSAIKNAGSGLAAVVLSHNPRTILAMKASYDGNMSYPKAQKKVRILIVPGHEPNYGGAEYGTAKERDINDELGQYLMQYLNSDSHFEVYITRDSKGWDSIFANYFSKNLSDIKEWKSESQEQMKEAISSGSTTKTTSMVYHNDAPKDVAIRLYGVTKWANENNMDIVLHLHINDYVGHGAGVPGKYTGFALYVPSQEYLNHDTSRAVAQSIFDRLSKSYKISNLRGESTGIVDDPDLIATGANNTADAASVLVEYGYIYEPQFILTELKTPALQNMAYQTYLGLKDFFKNN